MMNENQLPIVRRYHPTAKRLILRATIYGMQLTVPKGCDEASIDLFLAQSEPWIRKQQLKINDQSAMVAIDQLVINLPILSQQWQLKVDHTVKRLQVNTAEQQLTLPALEQSKQLKLLKQWLVSAAKQHLPLALQHLAAQHQLQVKQVKINCAKSRWGSCNHQAQINLNTALMLMPVCLAEHVMLHELSHTLHMNHSAYFWSTLERLQPNSQSYRQQLKQFKLPKWWLQANAV